MLPPINDVPIDQKAVADQQNSRRQGIFDNLSNSFSSSPKFMAQESLVKTLGNNFVTQGVLQIGSTIGDILDRALGRQEEETDNVARHTGPGFSDLDRNVFKEILRTLLRIESNTENLSSNAQTNLKNFAANDPDIEQSARITNEKKSAADIIERLNQKNPLRQNVDKDGNIIQSHFSDIGQSLTNTAATGVYEAFGYNILTQGAMDTVSLAGDLGSRILDKYGKTSSNDADAKVSESNVEVDILKETKDSKSVLNDILSTLTEISAGFKSFFRKSELDNISELETDMESKVTAKPPSPALPKELIERLNAQKEILPAAENESSILDKAADIAEIVHTMKDFKGTASILKKLGSLISKIRLPSAGMLGTATLAAAPLAVMGYAAHKAEDQTNDIENVESIKETSSSITDMLKNIGIDFSSRFDKIRENNRSGLDTTAELDAMKKYNSSAELEKTTAKLKDADNRRNSILSEGFKQEIANITNINSQTVIPTRYTVRSTESTANRYFDKALN
jgi:hypothetical protein